MQTAGADSLSRLSSTYKDLRLEWQHPVATVPVLYLHDSGRRDYFVNRSNFGHELIILFKR